MAWGASGPQWGASLTSSQYFPATANADEEGNLWADLLKGSLIFISEFLIINEEINFLSPEVAANKHSILPSRNLLVLGDRDRWLDFYENNSDDRKILLHN